MLCEMCPVRSICQTPCDDLERDLAKQTKRMFPILRSPADIEKIETETARFTFFGDREISEENNEVEPDSNKYRLIHDLMDSLTEKQRKCITLRFWEDLTPSEIGRELGISRKTAEGHLKAAFAVIRKEYQTRSLKTPSALEQG